MWAVEDSSIAAITEAWTALVRRAMQPGFEERLSREAGFDVRRGDYAILAHLEAHGPTSISGVAEALGLDTSTISRAIKDLFRRRMVERRRGDDQRLVVVAASPLGAQRLIRLRALRERVIRTILSDWSVEDRRALSDFLLRLSEGFADYLADVDRVPAAT